MTYSTAIAAKIISNKHVSVFKMIRGLLKSSQNTKTYPKDESDG